LHFLIVVIYWTHTTDRSVNVIVSVKYLIPILISPSYLHYQSSSQPTFVFFFQVALLVSTPFLGSLLSNPALTLNEYIFSLCPACHFPPFSMSREYKSCRPLSIPISNVLHYPFSRIFARSSFFPKALLTSPFSVPHILSFFPLPIHLWRTAISFWYLLFLSNSCLDLFLELYLSSVVSQIPIPFII